MKYLNFNIDDKIIKQYISKYKISKEEACKMYLDDNNLKEDVELTKINKKELKNAEKIKYDIDEKKERKKRVATISDEKQKLFQFLTKSLQDNNYNYNVLIKNKLIHLVINDLSFDINITQNRKVKKK